MDATTSTLVVADFTGTVNPHASPDLFGLSNEPSKDHAAAVYPLLQAAGFRFQRGTLHVNRLFDEPFPDATLGDWHANAGGIRESENWDWRPLHWLDHAERHGIRISSTCCTLRPGCPTTDLQTASRWTGTPGGTSFAPSSSASGTGSTPSTCSTSR
ncbi:hypothetical protein [Glycomyces sp. NPDC021274]|uniref:hypothetical protein n=1 Tax=Glycomyces sp. NPDC021274 TaxID=3155120 RepID=UPI0034034565